MPMRPAARRCSCRPFPAAVQVEYSLAQRSAERLGMNVLDWSPLAGGALTGKTSPPKSDGLVASGGVTHVEQYGGEATRVVARTVVNAATGLGCAPSSVAVAWLRTALPAQIPLVGARSVAQLADRP